MRETITDNKLKEIVDSVEEINLRRLAIGFKQEEELSCLNEKGDRAFSLKLNKKSEYRNLYVYDLKNYDYHLSDFITSIYLGDINAVNDMFDTIETQEDFNKKYLNTENYEQCGDIIAYNVADVKFVSGFAALMSVSKISEREWLRETNMLTGKSLNTLYLNGGLYIGLYYTKIKNLTLRNDYTVCTTDFKKVLIENLTFMSECLGNVQMCAVKNIHFIDSIIWDLSYVKKADGYSVTNMLKKLYESLDLNLFKIDAFVGSEDDFDKCNIDFSSYVEYNKSVSSFNLNTGNRVMVSVYLSYNRFRDNLTAFEELLREAYSHGVYKMNKDGTEVIGKLKRYDFITLRIVRQRDDNESFEEVIDRFYAV